MADTFYGMRSDIPALGTGMLEYDNDLMKASEDTEIDLMNDETFGDNIDDDFDWEGEHEKLAELEEEPARHSANKTRDSGYYPTDRSYRSQEEYLEQSISHMVLDDDEIEDDPAILNVSKSKPIPKKAQDLDDLFGPASPPAFLDTEHLVSPTSRNIWGSPIKETNLPPKQINNIQTLFEFAKAAKQPPPQAHVQPNVKTVEELEQQLMHRSGNAPQVMTAEDLERELRGESGDQRVPQLPPHDVRSPYAVRMPSQPPIGSPAARYQLHQTPQAQRVPLGYSPLSQRSPMPVYQGSTPSTQQILNGRRSPLSEIHHSGSPSPMVLDGRCSPASVLPGNTPPIHHILEGRRSPLMNISEILQNRRMSDGRISPVPIIGSAPVGGRISPIVMLQRRSPIAAGMSPINRTPSPPPINMSSPQFAVSPLTQARMMSPYGRGVSAMGMMGNRMPTQPIGIPRGMIRVNQPPSPYSSPNGPIQSPYKSPAGPRMPMNDRGRGGGAGGGRGHNRNNNQNNRNDLRPYHNFNRRRYYQFNEEAHHRQTVDEYAGLMTQKEKDWIIKIQLLQLQTDNPYLDDYYYTTFTLKKKAEERHKQHVNGVNESGDNNPELVIPAMAKLETREYRPAQFEGSLGRLTTSSVHNPRQIIDIKSKGLPGQDDSDIKGVTKELRKSRQLLWEIEKGYDLLLDIDEIEKKTLALPEEARIPLFEDRKQMLMCLYRYMLCEDHAEYFLSIMSVKKGRKLVARVLPLLEKQQAENVVVLLLKNLQSLIKKDQGEEGLVLLYDTVSRVIESSNLETLVRFSEELQQECPQSQSKSVAIAIQNKFGSSVICSLLHRGEIIYTKTSPLDLDSQHQSTWCQFVHDVAGILATVPTESLVQPLRQYKSISEHFDKLLNRKLVAIIEDKVKLFTETEVAASESGDKK